jgi:hypothetical protein
MFKLQGYSVTERLAKIVTRPCQDTSGGHGDTTASLRPVGRINVQHQQVTPFTFLDQTSTRHPSLAVTNPRHYDAPYPEHPRELA